MGSRLQEEYFKLVVAFPFILYENIITVLPRLSGIHLSGRCILFNIYQYITAIVHSTVHYFNIISKSTENVNLLVNNPKLIHF